MNHARESYDAPVRRYVEQELRAYLRCGVFAHGFVVTHGDRCGHFPRRKDEHEKKTRTPDRERNMC